MLKTKQKKENRPFIESFSARKWRKIIQKYENSNEISYKICSIRLTLVRKYFFMDEVSS